MIFEPNYIQVKLTVNTFFFTIPTNWINLNDRTKQLIYIFTVDFKYPDLSTLKLNKPEFVIWILNFSLLHNILIWLGVNLNRVILIAVKTVWFIVLLKYIFTQMNI